MVLTLTNVDEPDENVYLHDELISCDDTPDGKQSMAVWLSEICIDLERALFAYEELGLKEYERDHDGTWVD